MVTKNMLRGIRNLLNVYSNAGGADNAFKYVNYLGNMTSIYCSNGPYCALTVHISFNSSNNNESKYNAKIISDFSSIDNYLNNEECSVGFKIVFGSGNKPASIDDYDLEAAINESLTPITVSIKRNRYDIDNLSMYMLSVVAKNIRESNITIKEIGVYDVFNNTNNNYDAALLVREVLDEPVILKPNEYHSFTINICNSIVS